MFSKTKPPAKTKAKKVIISISVLFLCFFAGWLVGSSAGYYHSLPYLDLQSLSDSYHRLVIFVMPICLSSALFFGIIKYVFWHRRRLALFLTILSIACMSGSGCLIGFIIRFDRNIEKKGSLGQLVLKADRETYSYNLGPLLGPFEEVSKNRVTTIKTKDNHLIILDNHRLYKKSETGITVWSRKRPSNGLGALMLVGDLVLFLGPGPDFEGDAVITAIHIRSGRWLWSFHCLANRLNASPSLLEGNLYYIAKRHSISYLGAISLNEPKPVWSAELPAVTHLPPRITPKGIEAAVGSMLYLFDQRTGTLLSTTEACTNPQNYGVLCNNNQIQSFIDQSITVD